MLQEIWTILYYISTWFLLQVNAEYLYRVPLGRDNILSLLSYTYLQSNPEINKGTFMPEQKTIFHFHFVVLKTISELAKSYFSGSPKNKLLLPGFLQLFLM
jgi:hypothetical protein